MLRSLEFTHHSLHDSSLNFLFLSVSPSLKVIQVYFKYPSLLFPSPPCFLLFSQTQRTQSCTQTNTTSDKTGQIRRRHHLVFIKRVCQSAFVLVHMSARLSKHAPFKCTSNKGKWSFVIKKSDGSSEWASLVCKWPRWLPSCADSGRRTTDSNHHLDREPQESDWP